MNRTDLFFRVNQESLMCLVRRGNVESSRALHECSSISTLEWGWNHFPWGKKMELEVMDQAWFCGKLLQRTNSSFSSGRESETCEWDEWTIYQAAAKGNLEMLKYCFSNECPCDKKIRVNTLLQEEASTVFGFFSTK